MSETDYLYEKEKWIKDESITVKELIEILKEYPEDMKIMTTWESTLHSLTRDNIYESKTGSLYIDADENFYKTSFERLK